MRSCQINVDLWDKYQLDVEVEFEYEPYDPGVRYHPDGSGTPPSGDTIEVTNVRVLYVTNTVMDRTISREQLVTRSPWCSVSPGWFREQLVTQGPWWKIKFIHVLDACVYDLCYNSEPGEDIYDAIYDSRG